MAVSIGSDVRGLDARALQLQLARERFVYSFPIQQAGVMKLYLPWLCVLATSVAARSIEQCSEASSLRQLHVVYRHGDRTPTSLYPNDPNSPSDFPEGLGHITHVRSFCLPMYTIRGRQGCTDSATARYIKGKKKYGKCFLKAVDKEKGTNVKSPLCRSGGGM